LEIIYFWFVSPNTFLFLGKMFLPHEDHLQLPEEVAYTAKRSGFSAGRIDNLQGNVSPMPGAVALRREKWLHAGRSGSMPGEVALC
jgi:hypothetical protein